MKSFEMCDNCRKEYKDPGNRRFHAQPIACPECGPHIELWNENGSVLAGKQTALPESAYYLKMGKILAIKGLGGFQLLTDARKTECIERLRQRKRREEKPFALMFPSLDLIKKHCIVSLLEERILKSPEAPIVFLKRKNIPGISPEVAPDNPYLGIMLPYTPLHHLLLREIGFPVVATSANLSEDPMIYTDADALDKLKGIADFYLVHNRPIVRQVDDSIVRIIQDREMVMRRARGYAPLPVQINSETERELLAVGAHLKNTISIKKGKNIFISQHIGDLSSGDALKAFQNISGDMIDLYQIHNPLVVHDMHPDYLSTQQAKTKFKQTVEIQHHEAHVAACYAENQIDEEVLGVSWDGTGLGYDRNIWGGEFFRLSKKSISHIAQFQPFPLPGGDKAIKQPRRSLFGILYALYGKNISDKYNGLTTKFNKEEIKVLLQMLEKGINCPHTSSVGRIFDAVSSMLGIKDKINFEGQAAIMLEYLCDDDSEQTFPFVVEQNKLQSTINWKPMVESIIENITEDKPVRLIASKFHNTLAEIIVQVAEFNNLNKVIMSGGCFQNKILLERTIKRLRTAGMKAYWHQRIPTNDGGISLGQIVAAELWYNK